MWFLASWNVTTLLDVDGPIETARQGRDVDAVDERKIDQVVAEMEKYRVDVVAYRRPSDMDAECTGLLGVW